MSSNQLLLSHLWLLQYQHQHQKAWCNNGDTLLSWEKQHAPDESFSLAQFCHLCFWQEISPPQEDPTILVQNWLGSIAVCSISFAEKVARAGSIAIQLVKVDPLEKSSWLCRDMASKFGSDQILRAGKPVIDWPSICCRIVWPMNSNSRPKIRPHYTESTAWIGPIYRKYQPTKLNCMFLPVDVQRGLLGVFWKCHMFWDLMN